MIYLDHNATTPIALEVREAMLPYLNEEWGNPSSSYKFGSKLKGVIEAARSQVAELIGAPSRDVVFTSCATESNNTAINAALKANPQKRHIITSAVEHSSVLNYGMALEKENYRVTYLPVDRAGLLKIADLETALTDDTAIVSLMWANNETGVLFPVEDIARVCQGILSLIPNTELNGHKSQRLPNTCNLTFHGIESEALLLLLDQAGICASSGSACLADSDEPSHVVKAMKAESAASRQMIRFSLDVTNTATEIKNMLSKIQGAVKLLCG